jgi:hypothetical protein
VSLLSLDSLVIGLSPDKLTALRLGGRLRRFVHERHAVSLQAANSAQWDTLMTALEVLLDQPAWAARDLTFVLSSHYVYYAVIPGGKALTAAELNELARLVFRNIYGELSNDWVLRVSPCGNQSMLASAVPSTFLKALHDTCDGRGRLRSVQPALMSVFNRARGLIEQTTGTFALVETGRISLASVENGQWQRVISRAARSSALIQLLADERQQHDCRPDRALWLCDLTREVQLPADLPWRMQRLTPHPVAANSSQTLADWGVQ